MEKDEILRILLDWNYWGDYSLFRVISKGEGSILLARPDRAGGGFCH
jgi:hypothetical protein